MTLSNCAISDFPKPSFDFVCPNHTTLRSIVLSFPLRGFRPVFFFFLATGLVYMNCPAFLFLYNRSLSRRSGGRGIALFRFRLYGVPFCFPVVRFVIIYLYL